MKKLLSLLMALTLVIVSALSLVGCSRDYEGEIQIYMPDGAPALAFSKLMHDNNALGKDAKYTVVPAATIQTYIANETATAALVPVNLASKLCGKGDKYKMLSVNTHGNLYIIGSTAATTVADLKGKTVAVVNLANVPGLTLKAILSDNGIAYTDDASAKTADNVLLVGVADGPSAAATVKTGVADLALVPEPAATNLSKKMSFTTRISLQEAWTGGNGYPQAVLVAKTELTKDKHFVKALLDALNESATWVTTHPTEAVDAITAHLLEGTATTLNAAALNEAAITGSGIKVVAAKEMKQAVTDYITKINAVAATADNATPFGTPTDEFFA